MKLDIYNLEKKYDDFTLKVKEFHSSDNEIIGLVGNNGAGKTTLARLIIKELKPQSGELKIGVEKFACLDQNIKVLNSEQTLLENMERIAELNKDKSKEMLAHFLFRGFDVDKKIKILSGGEKIRAALACLLSNPNPPQLIILDEPTNNLDINSIKELESALNNYLGAMIIISHDQKFLEKIGINKIIKL